MSNEEFGVFVNGIWNGLSELGLLGEFIQVIIVIALILLWFCLPAILMGLWEQLPHRRRERAKEAEEWRRHNIEVGYQKESRRD